MTQQEPSFNAYPSDQRFSNRGGGASPAQWREMGNFPWGKFNLYGVVNLMRNDFDRSNPCQS